MPVSKRFYHCATVTLAYLFRKIGYYWDITFGEPSIYKKILKKVILIDWDIEILWKLLLNEGHLCKTQIIFDKNNIQRWFEILLSIHIYSIWRDNTNIAIQLRLNGWLLPILILNMDNTNTEISNIAFNKTFLCWSSYINDSFLYSFLGFLGVQVPNKTHTWY